MCVVSLCPGRPEEAVRFIGTVKMVMSSLVGWEQNRGLQQEQHVFLTTEPSPQGPVLCFCFCSLRQDHSLIPGLAWDSRYSPDWPSVLDDLSASASQYQGHGCEKSQA